ncbi:MAG: TonB-dependent receptor, partial [Pseudomonadota bacterium]
MISPDPADEVSGFVEAGLADRDGYSLAGALSGPIGERLRGSVSIGQEFKGGYAENTATGTTDDETSTAARGKLVFDATDTLTITGTVQITDLEAESINASSAPTLPGGQTIPLLGFPPTATIDASPDPYDSPLNEDGFVELSSVLSILRIDKEFDNFTVTSLTSYQDREAEQLGDFDRTDTNVALTTFDEDSQTFSQEFRFASDNFLGGKFVGGVFYYLDDAYRDDGFNWQSDSLPFVLNMGNPVQDNTIVDIETESFAVFGLYTYDFTDRLRLSAGGRYTDETKEFTMMGRTDLPMAPAVIENYDYSDDLSFDKFDPKVSVEYDLQDNVMLFASYTEGFKSGG